MLMQDVKPMIQNVVQFMNESKNQQTQNYLLTFTREILRSIGQIMRLMTTPFTLSGKALCLMMLLPIISFVNFCRGINLKMG